VSARPGSSTRPSGGWRRSRRPCSSCAVGPTVPGPTDRMPRSSARCARSSPACPTRSCARHRFVDRLIRLCPSSDRASVDAATAGLRSRPSRNVGRHGCWKACSASWPTQRAPAGAR
jgi:hypothetical protein